MNKETFLELLPSLLKDYQPSEEVREHIAQVDFFPIVGPSGVGKDTLITASGLHLVLSEMCREPRDGEFDGVHANFRTDFDVVLQQLAGQQFVQAVPGPGGELYGSLDSSYPPSGPALMPCVARVLPGMRCLGFRTMQPIYVSAPSYAEWMRRYDNRPNSESNRADRMAEARQSLELSLADPEVRFVLNDSIDLAKANVLQIVHAPESYAEIHQRRARQAAELMLEGLLAA